MDFDFLIVVMVSFSKSLSTPSSSVSNDSFPVSKDSLPNIGVVKLSNSSISGH